MVCRGSTVKPKGAEEVSQARKATPSSSSTAELPVNHFAFDPEVEEFVAINKKEIGMRWGVSILNPIGMQPRKHSVGSNY